MQVPVFVEAVAGNGFRAATGAPLNLVAEGATKPDALARLSQLAAQRFACGGEVVLMDLPGPADDPWRRTAGVFKDDPDFDEWQKAIAENRRAADAEPDHP